MNDRLDGPLNCLPIEPASPRASFPKNNKAKDIPR